MTRNDTSTETRYCKGYANDKGIGIPSAEVSWEETADLVVVGSGISGLMATMIAKEQGPELKVILLEKNPFLGGSTLMAECNRPIPVRTQADARRSAAERLRRSSFIANPMLWYELELDAAKNSAWLFGKHKVGYFKDGATFYEGGNGAVPVNKHLVPDATALGVDIRRKNRAKALILEDAHTCTGIQVYSEQGEVYAIHAKAVILCTGGMSTNKALLAYYSSQDMEKIIGWGMGQDGDGHLMAEQTAHGRANHLTVTSLFNNVAGYPYHSPLGAAVSMQYSNLFVNEDGIRFCDESQGGQLKIQESGKLVEGQGHVWSVADQSMIDRYASGGCQRHYSRFADVCVGRKIPDLQQELDAAIDGISTLKANTLAELAQAMGVPADTLTATITAYNRYAEDGIDEQWGKPAEYLWPCCTPPFYAFHISSGMLNTNGGIRINRNAQVVDPRHIPITGLYAAGICTSGWDGEVYGGGACQSVGMWSGSKAARHALEHLLGKTVAENWYGILLEE